MDEIANRLAESEVGVSVGGEAAATGEELEAACSTGGLFGQGRGEGEERAVEPAGGGAGPPLHGLFHDALWMELNYGGVSEWGAGGGVPAVG